MYHQHFAQPGICIALVSLSLVVLHFVIIPVTIIGNDKEKLDKTIPDGLATNQQEMKRLTAPRNYL